MIKNAESSSSTKSQNDSIGIPYIIWSIVRIFFFGIAIILLSSFFWFAFLGIGFGILIYVFSKRGNWSRHGIILALTIGTTGLLVKLLGAFYVYFGFYFLIFYLLAVMSIYVIKKIEKWGRKRRSINKRHKKNDVKSKSQIENLRLKTILKVILVITPLFLWSFLLFPRFAAGVEIEFCEDGRMMENLDRGLIAMRLENGSVYIGWRLLEDDTGNIAFNIYRANLTGPPLKLGTVNFTTDFVDNSAPNGTGFHYWIRPIVNELEQAPSKNSSILNTGSNPYISLKLNGTYTFQKVGIADLDGDGSFDFVIKQPNVNIDPLGAPLGNWRPSEDTYKVEAYLSNGTFLWRQDLGRDIEQGIWYSPYLVYDLDGDGKAEVAIKTGEEGGDHRDSLGRVRSGPEYLSIWDGLTGTRVTRVAWPERLAQIYNFNSRNQLGIAYLDGCHPNLLVARGTYWFMQLESYKYNASQLTNQWSWENTQESAFTWIGQGAHFMHSADVDFDGRDEVLLGSCVVNDNGVGLWSTGLQHPDHFYVGDIDPIRPGLEVYYGIEGILDIFPEAKNGICLVDAASGDIIWGLEEQTTHIHSQGLVSDIDPAFPGMECYSGEADEPKRWLHSSNGTLIATEATFDVGVTPKAVYWDADLQRELLYDEQIYDYESGFIHLQGVQGHQAAWADILGDWREEIIISLPGELRIYTTTIPAVDRRPCLMQDPIYRIDVAHLSMGYSQPPMTSYCLEPI